MAGFTRMGPHRGYVLSHAVGVDEKNGLVLLTTKLQLREFWQRDGSGEGQWYDLEQQDWVETTNYSYLTKKNGDFNDYNIDDAIRAFGWNGTEFSALAQMNLEGHPVQVYVDKDTYNGETTLKVKNLRAYDYDPSNKLPSASPSDLKALDARFGAGLAARKRPDVAKPAAAAAKPALPPPPAVAVEPVTPEAFAGKTAKQAYDEISTAHEGDVLKIDAYIAGFTNSPGVPAAEKAWWQSVANCGLPF